MTSLLFRARKFSTDADAVAATEFAIVVPFMLVLLVGGVELGDGMAINVKVSATAHSVADMVTQNTSLSTASMQNILTGATAIIAPYPVNNSQLTGYGVRNLQRRQWQPDPSMESIVQRSKLRTGKAEH